MYLVAEGEVDLVCNQKSIKTIKVPFLILFIKLYKIYL